MVEFALVLPFFLVVVMGTIDLGWALRAYVTLSNAAREGARYGITCKSNAAIQDRVVNYSAELLTTSNVTVNLNPTNACSTGGSYPDPPPGPTTVEVSVAYQYKWITPLGGMLSFVTGGVLPNQLALNSTSKMEFE